MQAKKVLDGSKHEYNTDMGWAHRTLQYTYNIHHTALSGGVSTTAPFVPVTVSPVMVPGGGAGAGVWRAQDGRGCWAGPGRAVCTGSRSHHGRAEKKPKCKPLGGEQQQQQHGGRPRAAHSVRCFTQYSPPAGRPAHTKHTCYTQHCFSELLDNIYNNNTNTTTATAALQLRCGDIGRQELSCAGQRCSLSDGDRQWSCQ